MKRLYTFICTITLLVELTFAMVAQATAGGNVQAQPTGSGTPDDPILIENTEQFVTALMGNRYYAPEATYERFAKCYRLESDIDLSSLTGENGWIPAGSLYSGSTGNISCYMHKEFTGTLDGNGKTIRGLSFSTVSNPEKSQNVGLIAEIGAKGIVKNLSLEVSYLAGDIYVGGLAGVNSGKVENCEVTVAGEILGNLGVGGLVGYSTGNVSGCSVIIWGKIQGNNNVGGMTGSCGNLLNPEIIPEIKGCRVMLGKTVTGSEEVGGMIGYAANCVLDSCSVIVTGHVISTSETFGESPTGGLVGEASGCQVTGCHADIRGIVTSVGGYVGGLVGAQTFYMNEKGKIASCNVVVSGTVNGTFDVGGLVGKCDLPIENCEAKIVGNISGSDNNVGGLIGNGERNLLAKGCSVTIPGQVRGEENAGGLAGTWKGTMEKCSATIGGTVEGINYVGGLIGDCKSSLENCIVHITGNITGTGSSSNVGGLIGHSIYIEGSPLSMKDCSVTVMGSISGRNASGVGGDWEGSMEGCSAVIGGTVAGTNSATGLVNTNLNDEVEIVNCEVVLEKDGVIKGKNNSKEMASAMAWSYFCGVRGCRVWVMGTQNIYLLSNTADVSIPADVCIRITGLSAATASFVLSNEEGGLIGQLTAAGMENASIYQTLTNIQSTSGGIISDEFMETLSNCPVTSQIFTKKLNEYAHLNGGVAINADGTVFTTTAINGKDYYGATGYSTYPPDISGTGREIFTYANDDSHCIGIINNSKTYKVSAIGWAAVEPTTFVLSNEEEGLVDQLIAAGYGSISLYGSLSVLQDASGGVITDAFMDILGSCPAGSQVFTKKLNEYAHLNGAICINTDGTAFTTIDIAGRNYHGINGYSTYPTAESATKNFTSTNDGDRYIDAVNGSKTYKVFAIGWAQAQPTTFVLSNEEAGLVDNLIAAGYGNASIFEALSVLQPSSGSVVADAFIDILAGNPAGSQIFTQRLNNYAGLSGGIAINTDGTVFTTAIKGRDYCGAIGYSTYPPDISGTDREIFTYANDGSYYIQAINDSKTYKVFAIGWIQAQPTTFVLSNEEGGLIDQTIAAGYGNYNLYEALILLAPASNGVISDEFLDALAICPGGSQVFTKKLSEYAHMNGGIAINKDGTVFTTNIKGRTYHEETGYSTYPENGVQELFTYANNGSYYIDAVNGGTTYKVFAVGWSQAQPTTFVLSNEEGGLIDKLIASGYGNNSLWEILQRFKFGLGSYLPDEYMDTLAIAPSGSAVFTQKLNDYAKLDGGIAINRDGTVFTATTFKGRAYRSVAGYTTLVVTISDDYIIEATCADNPGYYIDAGSGSTKLNVFAIAWIPGSLTVTTNNVDSSGITETSVIVSGSVTANDVVVTERGFVYGMSANPTIANSKVMADNGQNDFSAILSGLIAGATYHVRAYAIGSSGTVYGSDKTFATKAANILAVSTTSLNVSAVGSTASFNVISNTSWVVSSNQSWLTVNPANSSGNSTVTVTAQANPTTSTRTATVTVSGSGVTSQTVIVTQAAGAATLLVSTNSLSVAATNGSTATFNITSNTSWSTTSSQSWLTVNPASGTNNSSVTVTAEVNTTIAARSATITVSGSGVTPLTVTVTQAAGEATLLVSPLTLNVAASNGSTESFNVTSNISWTVVSNQSWLTVNPSSGTANGTVTVSAEVNPTNSTRVAIVTVSGSSVSSQTVTVTQAAGAAILNVSPDNLSFGQNGGTKTVDVISNATWHVSTEQWWITVEPDSGTGNEMISVTVEAYALTGEALDLSRTGNITILDNEANSKTVTITQEGSAGISDNNVSGVLVYPNPFIDGFYVNSISRTTIVSVFDIWGRLILERNISGKEFIPADQLENGIYLIELTDDQSSVRRELIKY